MSARTLDTSGSMFVTLRTQPHRQVCSQTSLDRIDGKAAKRLGIPFAADPLLVEKDDAYHQDP